MKPYKIIIFLFVLGFFFTSFSLANEKEPDYKSFIDIVYEWTPYGNMIQVGDYTISYINSVWLDDGGKDLIPVSKARIHVGDPVKAVVISQEDNGYWIADKIIVFSGKGLDDALKNISAIKKEEFLKKR